MRRKKLVPFVVAAIFLLGTGTAFTACAQTADDAAGGGGPY